MDPISLAGTVVGLIAPRLAKAGAEVARDAGVSALGKVDELVQAVREKLAGDPKRSEALGRLETPEAGAADQERLKNILVGEIAADEAFAQHLERLVEQSGASQGGFNVRVGGDVGGNITSIGPGAHVGNISAGGTSAPPSQG